MEKEKIICMSDVVDVLRKKGYDAEHKHVWIHVKTDTPLKMCDRLLKTIPKTWTVTVCRDMSGCNIIMPIVYPVEKDAENVNILYQWAVGLENAEDILA